jgi:hypothetical protein
MRKIINVLATLTSSILFGSLFISMPVLNTLNIFTQTNQQPDTPGIYAIIETVIAGSAFLVSIVAIYAGKERKGHNISGFLFIAFAIIQLVILSGRLYWKGVFTDLKILGDVGCRNVALEGNPVARFERYGNKEIKIKNDCVFNAFNSLSIDSGDKIDWANYISYDAVSRPALLAAAISAGENQLDLDRIPYYHAYWYWGCNSICHDRFKLNFAWLILSAFGFISYLLIGILFFCSVENTSTQVYNANDDEQDDQEDQKEDQGESNKQVSSPSGGGFKTSFKPHSSKVTYDRFLM